MECKEVRNQFADYLTEGSAGTTQSEVLRHLSVCEECREEAEELSDVWRMGKSVVGQEPDSNHMRSRFDAMLAAYVQGYGEGFSRAPTRKRSTAAAVAARLWPRRLALQIPLVMVTMAVGVFAAEQTRGWVIAQIIPVFVAPAPPQTINIPDPRELARQSLDRGVHAFRDRQYEEAAGHLRTALDLDRDLTVAETYLAATYARQTFPRWSEKLTERREGLPIDWRGKAALAAKAIEHYENVLAKEPKNPEALGGMAQMYQNTQQYRKAREYFLSYAQWDPGNPLPFYSVGVVDWTIVADRKFPAPADERSRLVDEGLRYLDIAISLLPDFDGAMTQKSLLFREKANLTTDADERRRLTAEAGNWSERALELRERKLGVFPQPLPQFFPPPEPLPELSTAPALTRQ